MPSLPLRPPSESFNIERLSAREPVQAEMTKMRNYLRNAQSSIERDRNELARVGKKEVLKVWLEAPQCAFSKQCDWELAEKLRFHVYAWFWLHCAEHLGRRVDVSIRFPALCGTNVWLLSLFVMGFAKYHSYLEAWFIVQSYSWHCSGGPSGLVYGFIITWIGTLSIFTVLSELSSMWVRILRTHKFRKHYPNWALGFLPAAVCADILCVKYS